jgi:hypothetical protein
MWGEMIIMSIFFLLPGVLALLAMLVMPFLHR